MKAYLKLLGRPGRSVEIDSYHDIKRVLGGGPYGLDHLCLSLENMDCTVWAAVNELGPSPANLNFTTRTHTHGEFSGRESYGFPIYGDALIQKTDIETGEMVSMTEADLAFMKIMTGEFDVNPNSYRYNPYRYNPYSYHHNPSEAEDMEAINDIMGNLTPCDEADWGIKRRYYRSRLRRNPDISRKKVRWRNDHPKMGKKKRRSLRRRNAGGPQMTFNCRDCGQETRCTD